MHLVNDLDLPAGGGPIEIVNTARGTIDLDEIIIKDIPDPKGLK